MLLMLVLFLVAYLIGAIPFALLLSRMKGVDIRQVGSGNVGATNVFRSVSKGLGAMTFTCDVLKGFLPVFLFPLIWPVEQLPENAGLLYGCAAIAGHNWPVYLRFRGGKGVATSAGVLLGVAPPAVGIGLATWIALFVITRYVSLASIGAAIAIPAASWWLYGAENLVLPIILTILGMLIIWRHRSNIKRLLDGTEHEFRKEKVGTTEDAGVRRGGKE